VSTTDAAGALGTGPAGVALPPPGGDPLSGALFQGQPLVEHATRTLRAAGVVPLPAEVPWRDVVGRGGAVVVLDARCPLVPAAFVAHALTAARTATCAVVAVRPVTDTVKPVVDGWVGESLDRDGLALVASPVVLPAAVAARAGRDPRAVDLTSWVEELRRDGPVRLLEAPSVGRRVTDLSDLRLLAAG